MKHICLLFSLLMLLAGSTYAGNDKIIIPSVLKSAVVYRAGAELHHTAKATLEKGSNDVIIEGISNNIDINSLQFGSNGGVTVMSVEFSTDFIKPSVKSAVVRRLEDSIAAETEAFEKLQVVLRTDKDLLDLLNANKEIRGTQNGLSVAELGKMMDYYKSKTLELQNEIADYEESSDKIRASLGRLKSQLQEEEAKNTRTTGRLSLQLFSPMSGSFNFTISYVTQNAYWNPYYDLFVESVNKPVKLVYRAKLNQFTGIDWKQVKLSLSTSTPGQHDNAPVLKSWFLGYVDPAMLRKKELNVSNSMSGYLAGRVAGVSVAGFPGAETKIKIRGQATISAAPIYVVNGNIVTAAEYMNIAPESIASVNVLKDANATAIYGSSAAGGAIVVTLKSGMGDYVSVNDNELNVVFDIDLPYDMASNSREQSILLKETNVPAVYKFYSVPKMDKESYLLGDIADWEKLNLIPGEANIIFEGTYVGKSFIDPANTQDTLTLTLGRDKRIVVKRDKLVDFSSVKFLGSNKKQVFNYEITVKNNKKEKVSLLLKDQYPLSTNKDIEVELLETSGALVNTDLGVLNWNIELNPGESKKYKLSYSIKYPKDKQVNLN